MPDHICNLCRKIVKWIVNNKKSGVIPYRKGGKWFINDEPIRYGVSLNYIYTSEHIIIGRTESEFIKNISDYIDNDLIKPDSIIISAITSLFGFYTKLDDPDEVKNFIKINIDKFYLPACDCRDNI